MRCQTAPTNVQKVTQHFLRMQALHHLIEPPHLESHLTSIRRENPSFLCQPLTNVAKCEEK